MNESKFEVMGIVFGIATLMAFMLPLARPLPTLETKNSAAVREKLLQDKDNFLSDYVLVSSKDWRDMWREPIRGVSGFQIVFDSSDQASAERVVRILSNDLFGKESVDARVWIIAAWPLLAVLALGGFLFPLLPRKLLLAIGGLLVLLYALARWKLSQSYMIDVELNLCLGFWALLYAGFLLGLCCLICGMSGGAKK